MGTFQGNTAQALEIARKTFSHISRHRSAIIVASAPWFLMQVVLGTLTFLAGTKPPLWVGLVIFAGGFVQVWLSVPVIVFCHRLVLFGADSVRPGVPLRWGTTEWRFLGNGLLIGLIALILIVLMLAAAIGTGLLPEVDPQSVSTFASLYIVMLPAIVICGLAMLYAPIVVVGGAKPIATSFTAMWRRRGLWLLLFGGFVVVALAASTGMQIVGRALAAALGYGIVVIGVVSGILTIANGVVAATGLSFLFLHLREELPPEAIAPENTPTIA